MKSKTISDWKGLFRYDGYLSLPDGALLRAENVVLNRKGVIEPHRGKNTITGPTWKSNKMAAMNILDTEANILLGMNWENEIIANSTMPLKRINSNFNQGFDINAFKYNIQSGGGNNYFLAPQIKSYNGFAYISGDEPRVAEISSTGLFQESVGKIPVCLDPQNNTTLLSGAVGSLINPGVQIAYRFMYQIKKNIYNYNGKKIKEHIMNGAPSGRLVVNNPYVSISSISKSGKNLTLTVENASNFNLVAGSVINLKNIKAKSTGMTFSYNSGTKVMTVSLTNHGYSVGDLITYENANVTELEGSFLITSIIDPSTYTFVLDSSNTIFTADSCYKDKDIANGNFTVKSVSGNTIVVEVYQVANASSHYADNSFEPENSNEFMKMGAYVKITIDLRKQFGSSSNEKYNLLGFKSEEADLENGLIASDRLYKFYEAEVTNLGVSTLNIVDNIPEEFLGESLYTNDNLPDNAVNYQPPGCADLEVYKDFMFYVNTKRLANKKLSLFNLPSSETSDFLRAEALTPGSATPLTITNSYTTYNYYPSVSRIFSGTSGYFESYQDIKFTSSVGSITFSGGVLTVVTTSTSGTRYKHLLKVGDVFSLNGCNEAGFNSIFRVASVSGDYTLTANVVGVALPSTASHATGGTFMLRPFASVTTQILKTVQSLIRVMNESTVGHTYGQTLYDQNNPTTMPGDIFLTSRTLGVDNGDVLTVNFNSSGTYWSPDLRAAASAENKGFNYERKCNNVIFSKQYFPHAVPTDGSNEIQVGGSDTFIYRAVSLADALYFFTSNGIYRLTGDTPKDFNLQPYDLTTIITSPESLAVVDGAIYFLSNKGIVKIGGNGVDIISKQVEYLVEPYSLYKFGFDTPYMVFGWGYESERRYYFSTVDYCLIYDIDKQLWTTTTVAGRCGIEIQVADYSDHFKKLYYDGLTCERKSVNSLSIGSGSFSSQYNLIDYKLQDISKSVTVLDDAGLIIAFNNTAQVGLGGVIRDSATGLIKGTIKEIVGTNQYKLIAPWTGGDVAVKYANPIPVTIEVVDGDTTDITKKYQQWRAYPEFNTFSNVNYMFITDLARDNTQTMQNLDYSDRDMSNVQTHISSPITEFIPPMLRRGRLANLTINHQVAEEKLTIQRISILYTQDGYKPSRTSEGVNEN